MRDVGQDLGIPMHVFGTETHMTAIVAMALHKRDVPRNVQQDTATANFLLGSGKTASTLKKRPKSFSSGGGSFSSQGGKKQILSFSIEDIL